jgi:hypothetical protein
MTAFQQCVIPKLYALLLALCMCVFVMCCVVNRLLAGEPELGFDFQHSWSHDWVWNPPYLLM